MKSLSCQTNLSSSIQDDVFDSIDGNIDNTGVCIAAATPTSDYPVCCRSVMYYTAMQSLVNI